MATVLSQLRNIPAYKLTDLYPNIIQANLNKLLWVRQTSVDSFPQSNQPVEALYNSVSAINTADYNDFPIGSEITDCTGATKKKFLKTAVSTWVALSYS